jgi:hypothetical protein
MHETASKTDPLDPETNGTNIDSLTLFVSKAQGTTHSLQVELYPKVKQRLIFVIIIQPMYTSANHATAGLH